MKQQTAVEWLIEQVESSNWLNLYAWHKKEVFEHAKKMEKEELNIARLDGINLANGGYGTKTTSDLPNVNPDDVIASLPQFVKQTIV